MDSIFKKGRLILLCGVLMLGSICIPSAAYAQESISYKAGSMRGYINIRGSFLWAERMRGVGSPFDNEQAALDQIQEEPVNTGEEYSFDTETYPYYALLSEQQQAVYHQVYANAVAENASFTLVESLTADELSSAVCAVYNDHPELFWLETSYSYIYSASGQAISMTLQFYMTGDELEAARVSFNAAAEELVRAAEEYETEIEKELYVHDAINAMVDYDEGSAMNQSAYSALVNKTTVCAGYARAFQYIMQQLGFNAYYCTGTADGGDHAWNIIEIEGDFYNVDLTWDDSISDTYGENVYTYFNVTDSYMSADHIRSGLSAELSACTATEMSYTNVYGDTITIDDIHIVNGGHNDGNMTIDHGEDVADWKSSHDREIVKAPQNTGDRTKEATPSGVMPVMPVFGFIYGS